MREWDECTVFKMRFNQETLVTIFATVLIVKWLNKVIYTHTFVH